MFFVTVSFIASGTLGLWSGHWLHRRFGRSGTLIVCFAFMAAICVGHWALGLMGSDEHLLADGDSAPAYRVETPRQ